MGMETGRKWLVEEKKIYMNTQKLPTVKNGILSFTKMKPTGITYIQSDNLTAILYLLKMGCKRDKKLVDLSKDVWENLLLKQITITAEYLPGILSTRADWSQQKPLRVEIISKIFTRKIRMPITELFAFRLSNQIAKHFAWKPDPNSLDTDEM